MRTSPRPLAKDLVAGGARHLFICGNDEAAKAQVTAWLKEWLGWEHVLDLGDISAARATEMLLPIWLRLMGRLGTPRFNFWIAQYPRGPRPGAGPRAPRRKPKAKPS